MVKPLAKSPNAVLARNIARFHALHAEHKEGEKQLDALKTYFREEAGDEDMVFVDGKGLEVVVTWEERTSWDGAVLEHFLGDRAPEYKKTTQYAKVGCRTAKKTA